MKTTVALLVLALIVPAARADNVPRAAVQHFQKGRELQEAGKYDEALAEYRAAQALAPRPANLFNMAQCLRKMGNLAEALDLYQQFVDGEPEGRRIDEARGYIALLREQLATREEPQPQPPPAPAAAAAPPPASPPPPRTIVDAPPRSRRTLRIASYAAGGAGLAALGAGVYFGLRARTAERDLESGWSRDTFDAGRAANRNMYVAYGAGAAAVAAGVVLYLISSREVRAAPVVGPGAAGLSVSGRF